MIWLGSKRGYLSDWSTQCWVRLTGRRVDLDSQRWLPGPIASTRGISPDYFTELAHTENLRLTKAQSPAGVIPDFTALTGSGFASEKVHPAVSRFYQETSEYELDAWAQWCGLFRPFGWLLAVLFSRRLQQLNVPLSGLDTSKGITNEVLQFTNAATGELRHTAWFRRLQGSGNILYAGFYSVCALPDRPEPCVKVLSRCRTGTPL